MYNIAANIGNGDLSHKIDLIRLDLYILNLKGHQTLKIMAFFVDFSIFGNIGNLNPTLESPQIFNRCYRTLHFVVLSITAVRIYFLQIYLSTRFILRQ